MKNKFLPTRHSLQRAATLLLQAAIFLLTHTQTATAQSLPAGPPYQITATAPVVPLFRNEDQNVLIRIKVYVTPGGPPLQISAANISANGAAMQNIDSVFVYYTDIEPQFHSKQRLGAAMLDKEKIVIPAQVTLPPGLHYLWLIAGMNTGAMLDARPEVHITALVETKKKTLNVTEEGEGFKKRIGFALRKKGEDGVHTYRIPGLATTDKGTLIAVYDVRYNNARDLPGDIDVGMSRSTDGGHTWETMKLIMDMGEPQFDNGIGDPAILSDPATKKIWVAALWSKGNRSIAGSVGGLSPDSTGQFMLAYSDDDGSTWSQPVNITPQVKDPKWTIFFQGPGSGIAMKNGTLVFPAQYWDENRKPYSTIIYSDDHGLRWKSGVGAKSNTTESAVAETEPGLLLLNMRDNRGRFRSTSVSADMGKTWTETANSYSALPDPVCMASMIKAHVQQNGKLQEILFFSNENNQYARTHTTVKASLDLGTTWPETNQLLVDERSTFGYSSLAQIDEKTIGLLYEGAGDIYFVRIPVDDIIK